MVRLRSRTLVSAIAVTGGMALATSAIAGHSWNGYHWPRSTNPLALSVGNNVSGADWKYALENAVYDWNTGPSGGPASPFDLTATTGETSPRKCQPVTGTVQVCNYTYGYRGWLGVAQIWLDGKHITEGTVKLNDSYFQSSTYDSVAWRAFVTCQELGHTLGLGHTDEDFYNTNEGTCMDYTDDPDGTLKHQASNMHPNQHDFDELALIYDHSDTTSTGTGDSGGPPGGGGPPGRNKSVDGGSDVADWGQAISYDIDGRPDVFVKTIAPGRKVVTHVLWVPARQRQHAG